MPMEESYWEQMKSPIADMKNTGGRMGGAITAALFLEKYVDTEKVPPSLDPGITCTPGALDGATVDCSISNSCRARKVFVSITTQSGVL